MGNAWTEHVREFAKTHNVSYMCALSMPDCKASYHNKRPQKLTKKQKKEVESMGAEEQTGIANRELHAKQVEHKRRSEVLKKKQKAKEAKETEQMGIEDQIAHHFREDEKQMKDLSKAFEEHKQAEEQIDAGVPAKKKAGRPKKYLSKEEATEAKKQKTVESNRRRRAEKKEKEQDKEKEKKQDKEKEKEANDDSATMEQQFYDNVIKLAKSFPKPLGLYASAIFKDLYKIFYPLSFPLSNPEEDFKNITKYDIRHRTFPYANNITGKQKTEIFSKPTTLSMYNKLFSILTKNTPYVITVSPYVEPETLFSFNHKPQDLVFKVNIKNYPASRDISNHDWKQWREFLSKIGPIIDNQLFWWDLKRDYDISTGKGVPLPPTPTVGKTAKPTPHLTEVPIAVPPPPPPVEVVPPPPPAPRTTLRRRIVNGEVVLGRGLIAGYSAEADNGLSHIYPLSHTNVLKMLKHLI